MNEEYKKVGWNVRDKEYVEPLRKMTPIRM